MAYLLGCENIRLEFPTVKIFDSLTLGVNDGDRIGIVGKNGDGKSSLLQVLSGAYEPDEGRVVRTNGVRVGYLGQQDSLSDDATLVEAVVGDIPEYEWAGDARIRGIMAELLGDIDPQAKIGTLSGGQRRRADLARVLIGQWDVLMMDEPTNHLDIEGIHWLANHLKYRWRAGSGALLLITHDRWFLDEVCLDMWEVHDRIVTPFEGGYSAYIQQRVERDRQAAVAATKRRNILRKELAWLARQPQARGTKPKFRKDAALELIADEPPVRQTIELRRSAMSRLGKKVINLKGAGVSFDGREVIKPVELNIGAGDRIGILGANGAGKTTLLSLMQGKLAPACGRVEIGQTVKMAVLDQQLSELKEIEDDFVRVVISRYKTRYELDDGREVSPSQLLQELGFDSAQLNCPVKDLSGGQRRRLQLCLILLDRPNVLILDEPGNDLDTDMLAQVENLLDSWPGTMLLVSHDRYLTERVTDDQYALVDGELIHMPRGVDQYLELVESRKGQQQAASSGPVQAIGVKQEQAASANEAGGLGQRELRELKKRRNSADRKLSTARSKLAKANDALAAIDGFDFAALIEQQAVIDGLKAQIADLEDEWLEVSELLGD